jgi:hypothetical protein
MEGQCLPLVAQTDILKGSLEAIQDRIFNISIYAGLMEEIVVCRKGKPAPATELVHVHQRMLYMDEECLLNYQHGGMSFAEIRDFDKWVAKPENRDRMLPHQKCVVVMRVRRNEKERDWSGGLIQLFANIEEAKTDKFTFLYIRNGEQVSRLITELDFDAKLFPDATDFDDHELVMIKAARWRSDGVDVLPLRLFEEMIKEKADDAKKLKQWKKENREKDTFFAPYELKRHADFNPEDWRPATPDHIEYDKYVAQVAATIKKYNRVAIILQGLFDRSDVFKPHAPARLWQQDEFERTVKFVYDFGAAMTHGDPPDFEAYRKKLNRSIAVGSLTIGQRHVWGEREAEKENARQARDWRVKHKSHYDWYAPYGNPGPTKIAKVDAIPRKGQARFEWTRESQSRSNWGRNKVIACSVTAPFDRLLNVSAYQLGDYKQFFQDPRTRADYLKWAPFLLAAEEWHAGNRKMPDDD